MQKDRLQLSSDLSGIDFALELSVSPPHRPPYSRHGVLLQPASSREEEEEEESMHHTWIQVARRGIFRRLVMEVAWEVLPMRDSLGSQVTPLAILQGPDVLPEVLVGWFLTSQD